MKNGNGGPRFRASLLAVLLVAATILVVVLAVQAWAAQVYHQQATEEVLRDYASLAADEALRRIALEIGYYSYDPAIVSLRDAVAAQGGLPDLDRLKREAPEQTAEALELVGRLFLYDSRDDSIVTQPEGRVPAGLTERLGPSLNEQGFATIDLGDTLVVYGQVEGDDRQGRGWVGFVVDRKVLRRRCAEALERQALLPASLGEGDLDNSVLYLRAQHGTGHELYASGDNYDSGLVVERQPSATYRSVLPGLRVRAAIDPEAAHRLVIGGLPRSRLPLLATVFALTAGLLVASILLLRRERALVQMRSDFVSRVSHELRTPLTQIRMFTETLRLGRVRSDDERRQYLEILDRETQRLTALVENVLQLSRSERGQSELDLRLTRIAPLLERLAEEVKPFLEARGSVLELDVEPGLRANLAADGIHQALLNLIDNAVKYGPDGQAIRLSAHSEGNILFLWVDDQGPGIPASERESVWRPFHRSGNSSQTGTGIGLAVVRDLVEQHGGRSWVEPRQPHGTRVVLELPQQLEDAS